MKDAFNPPVVTKIDTTNYKGQATDTVKVEANDDFEVTAVKVSIHTAAGELVEEGYAVLEAEGLFWLYTVTGENESSVGSKIKATAFDKAGNEASLEITV